MKTLVISAAISLVLLNPFVFAQEECEKKILEFCPDIETHALGKTASCLEKNKSNISEECSEGFQEFLDVYYGAKAACGADYKKLCNLDINKMTPQTQYGPAWEECLVSKWGDFSEGCKQVFRGLPFFSEMEPGFEKISQQEKAKTRKKIKVSGTNQTVISEYIDGDIVWYKARIKKKKILEDYEHCPVLDRKRGLKRDLIINAGICRYSVTADWRSDLIADLKEAGLMEKIDHHGVVVKRRQDIMTKKKEYEQINDVMLQYDHYCPEGFQADVEHYVTRKETHVLCSKKGGYSCKQGFISSEEGYELGCVRLAACEETSDKYESIGQEFDCGLCYAGGCIDQEKSSDSIYPLCKVNYKNPDQTACEEYRVRRSYYDNGKVRFETYYKINYPMKQITYDENGDILRVKKFDHASRWNLKEYDGEGRLRSVKYNAGDPQKFYDEQGSVIDVDQLKNMHAPDPVTGEAALYRFKLDQAGRPLKQYTYKTVLLVKEWIRDADGKVVKVIDYDEQGNVIKEENPLKKEEKIIKPKKETEWQ